MNFEDADNGTYHIECPEGDVTYTHKETRQTTLDDYGIPMPVRGYEGGPCHVTEADYIARAKAIAEEDGADENIKEIVRAKGASKVHDPYPHFNEMIFDQNFRCNEYVHMRNGTEFAKDLRADAITDPELRRAMEVWIAQAAELDRALRLLIELEKVEPKFCWRGQRMPEEGRE